MSKVRISRAGLKRIIKEEASRLVSEQDNPTSDVVSNNDHHWPRIEWDNSIGALTDKWHDMEMKAFDPGDPSMRGSDDMSVTDAKDYWREQVDQASYDLENELTVEVRKVALEMMKKVSSQLINGDYS